MNASIVEMLDEAAKQKDVSTYAICQELGIANANYHNWKNGKSKVSDGMAKKVTNGLARIQGKEPVPVKESKRQNEVMKAISVIIPSNISTMDKEFLIRLIIT